MRTTVRLDDELIREVKRYAAEHNQTLTSLIEQALREKLMKRQEPLHREPFKLEVFPRAGQGLQLGVDLDDSAALLDLMEER